MVRAAASWWGLGAWIATLAFGAAAGAATRVYGIEHEVDGPTRRIRVMADGLLQARFEARGKRRGELVIEGATLDPGAPRSVEIPPGGPFFQVTAAEQTGAEPRVVLTVLHAQDLTAKIVRRGTELALELVRSAAPEPPSAGLILDVKDFPLREVVLRVARHTGQAMLHDETLQGNVTIMAKQPFSAAEALRLLDTVLLMKGYVALPSPNSVLPPGVRVAFKPGEVPGVMTEWALVELKDRPYIVTIMGSFQLRDEFKDAMRQISQTAYDFFLRAGATKYGAYVDPEEWAKR